MHHNENPILANSVGTVFVLGSKTGLLLGKSLGSHIHLLELEFVVKFKKLLNGFADNKNFFVPISVLDKLFSLTLVVQSKIGLQFEEI